VHGDLEKAVYAYLVEHYTFWGDSSLEWISHLAHLERILQPKVYSRIPFALPKHILYVSCDILSAITCQQACVVSGIQQDRVADPEKKFEVGTTGGAKLDNDRFEAEVRIRKLPI